MRIELSLFTNAAKSAPKIDVISRTYESFVAAFGAIPKRIYFDPHPNIVAADAYREALINRFDCQVIDTTSLSDGYTRSLRDSDADYLFQLEHDWLLHGIHHSLEEIMAVMQKDGIYHFRFSKHPNTLTPALMKWQTVMVERECNGMKYCETDNLSNNPHIVDRRRYLDLIPRMAIKAGSSGIEENLTKKGLIGCQYGPIDYPKTITHIDGKRTS